MPLSRRHLGFGLLGAAAAWPAAAQEMRRPVSFQARRYQNVVRQVLEFSCGSAALATVLTFYLNRPTTEADVITLLRERYPTREAWTEKAQTGFSFEDIMFCADRLGFAGQAARMDARQLPRLAGPVIVHLDKGSWQHFSVLRVARDGFYYLADPIAGQTTFLEAEFRREFTGAVLAVWRRGESLPTRSPLQAIRDGVSVERTLFSAIEAAQIRGFPPPAI